MNHASISPGLLVHSWHSTTSGASALRMRWNGAGFFIGASFSTFQVTTRTPSVRRSGGAEAVTAGADANGGNAPSIRAVRASSFPSGPSVITRNASFVAFWNAAAMS